MTALIAIVCYSIAWASLIHSTKNRAAAGVITGICIAVGTAVHGYSAYNSIDTVNGIQFGFFQVASVLFVCMNIIVLLSAMRQPLTKLFLILLPLSIVSITCSNLFSTQAGIVQGMDAALVTHVMLSIIAYSLLTIATLQAILLNYQTTQLKAHHVKSVLGIFPPLQTMETLLFDMVWAGFVLLSLSIGTGAVFIDNMFEQHLTHKTAFSVISWLIYATLLFGRHALGWRGKVAIRWVIAGFVMLMLAYFGSKFVLEIVLAR